MDRLNVLSLLGLSLRGGRLAIGEEPAEAAARARDARVLLLASDAAEGTRRRCEHFARAGDCLWLRLPFTKEELGRALGRTSVAIAAVTDVGLADALLRRLAELDPAAYAEASERMALKAAGPRSGRPSRPPTRRTSAAASAAPRRRPSPRKSARPPAAAQRRTGGRPPGSARRGRQPPSIDPRPPKDARPQAEGTDAVRPQPPGEKGQGLLPQEGQLTDRAAAARGRGRCFENFPSPPGWS